MATLNCDACGQELAAEDRFCGECGASVTQASEQRSKSEKPEEPVRASLSEPVPKRRSISPSLIVGLLVVAGLVGYFVFSSNVENVSAPSATQTVTSATPTVQNTEPVPRPSAQQDTPVARFTPMVVVAKHSSSKAKRCNGPSNCVRATGEFSIGETLVSNEEPTYLSIDTSDGKKLSQLLRGSVARTEPPPGSIDAYSFVLLDGRISVKARNVSLYLVLGNGFCEISNGNFSARQLGKNGLSEFVLSAGGARCEDHNGNLHHLSQGKNLVAEWSNR